MRLKDLCELLLGDTVLQRHQVKVWVLLALGTACRFGGAKVCRAFVILLACGLQLAVYLPLVRFFENLVAAFFADHGFAAYASFYV